jgi:hypothetical protein
MLNIIMKKLLLIPKYAVAFLFLLYEFAWHVSKQILKFISNHPYMVAFGLLLKTFPAYLILTLFAIPFGFSEIITCWAYLLIAGGDFINGSIIWLCSKVFGFIPMVWIFQQTKEKLLSIKWFLFLYTFIKNWKHRIHDYITSLSVWISAKKIAHNFKIMISSTKERIKKFLDLK